MNRSWSIPGEVKAIEPRSLDRERMGWLRPYVRQSSLDVRLKWQTGARRLLDFLLVHIISGDGLFIVDHVKYQVSENSLVWIPPDTDHEMYGYGPRMELGYIHFDLIYDPERSHWDAMIPDRVCNLTRYKTLLHPAIPDAEIASWSGVLFRGNTPPPVARQIHQIIQLHRREGRHTLQLSAMQMELVAMISDARSRSSHQTKQIQLFQKAAQAISEAVDREPDLQKLAADLKISSSHLRNLFHHYRNCSPREFHQMARISKGCELLSYTDLNISEIADELGFGSIYSFSRAFKSVMGMSPSRFRNGGAPGEGDLNFPPGK